MYKFLTAALAETMVKSMAESENGELPLEQKALKRGRDGCLDALLVDAMINEDAVLEGRYLSSAWLDFQKAFDSVPHGWLIEVLKVYDIQP